LKRLLFFRRDHCTPFHCEKKKHC
jgi:hypothetical protein